MSKIGKSLYTQSFTQNQIDANRHLNYHAFCFDFR